MSDNLCVIGEIKFRDRISVGGQSPNLHSKFLRYNRVSLTLSVTNNFMKELFNAHTDTHLAYVHVVNSQITHFQLTCTDRLELRLKSVAFKVQQLLKTKYRSGRKRRTFLSEIVSISVLDTELEDVKSLSFTLSKFCTQSLDVEKRCAKLVVGNTKVTVSGMLVISGKLKCIDC